MKTKSSSELQNINKPTNQLKKETNGKLKLCALH